MLLVLVVGVVVVFREAMFLVGVVAVFVVDRTGGVCDDSVLSGGVGVRGGYVLYGGGGVRGGYVVCGGGGGGPNKGNFNH